MSRSAEAPFLPLNKAHIFISKCFGRMFTVSFEKQLKKMLNHKWENSFSSFKINATVLLILVFNFNF